LIFNSIEFLLFFPLVVFLYFALTHRFRWIVLLIASYYFYMAWKPEYVVLLISSTLVNYLIGLRMGKKESRSDRKHLLILSLLFNIGTLFVFKYFNFFIGSVDSIVQGDFVAVNIILPIGISFYTFQTMSYTIDVYRGKRAAEKHVGIFALYVSFFPQLVAGPIERSDRLLPQFYEKHNFDYENFTFGLKRMAIGFFKKVVIADRISMIVNTVYNSPSNYGNEYLFIATIGFGIQIYCDFSGYSDIAIGASRVMGFKLMENFERPYFSKSISEFWGRWHISLSTWFRDYLYIPLGGNRVKLPRYYMNIMITFLVSGLWHGAKWTFVIWGGIHGVYLIFGRILKPAKKYLTHVIGLHKLPLLHKIINIAITFFLVMFAWIFFRANNFIDAMYISTRFFSGAISVMNPLIFIRAITNMGLNTTEVVSLFPSLIILFMISYIERKQSIVDFVGKNNIFIRHFIYYLFLLYLIAMSFNGSSEFIYFQF
jgi:alginate O-acetyltransferase complex protein AlgI